MIKYLLTVVLFSIISATAQTFTSANGGPIPDGGPLVQFPLTVSGLTPSAIDSAFGIETICFNITHTWDADLNISLQSPDGTIIDLSIANGGDGDDYTNTCLNAFASSSITTASPPFTGTFKPQGFIGTFNNGQNPNGIWNLLIEDTYGADAGNLIDWSITFGNNPAYPFSFTSSNLPIVVINTGGNTIPDEPKLEALMGIIYNGVGVRNYVTDPFNNYYNKIGIEQRGSSSYGFPQKSYGFETRDVNGTQKDTILLGMPAEHDWILYAPYNDKTCIRNVLSYDIANKTGHYAPRTRLCELIIDGNYQGIYVITEKIKRDANRVNISKLQPTDISGDDLTGGYIIKVDRDDGFGSYWTSPYPAADGSSVNFVHVYPKWDVIIPQQRAYIMSYIDTVESVLASIDFADSLNGYRKYIGVKSFIDYFILNEISKNVDGYRLSTFFYKDKNSQGGKLKAGPAWDYNLGWWNADYCDGNISSGWAYNFGSVCPGGWQPNFWWARLLEDSTYTAQLRCRWQELRAATLSISTLNNYIDSLAAELNEAQARHFTIWPILGQYTWPNPSPLPADYAGEIAALKTWIADRIAWLDTNLPGTCNNVGLKENGFDEENVVVYPNPFRNSINIRFYLPSSEKLTIQITDIVGKVIKQIDQKQCHYGENNIEIGIDEKLSKGVYLLKIISSKGTILKKLSKAE